jgi:hypothetical protein
VLWLLLLLLPPAHADWALATAPNTPENVELLRSLGAGIEGGDRDTILFDLPADALAQAQSLVPLDLITPDTSLLRPVSWPDERDEEYHDPETVEASLRALAETYPDIVRLLDVGDSVEGRDLWAVVLTDQPDRREVDEPSVRVLGTHHGDEWSSMEVPLALAWRLAEDYVDGDPGVVDLLDDNELWILPVVNPDGVVAFERRNSNGIDLNRNYAYEWLATSWSGPTPFSEPEARAVRALSVARSFHHSISMHSGATNIGWVWNWSTEDTPEDAFMAAACETYMADTDQADFWVSQGSDWYITRGDTNDWSYGVRGGQDYTLEITDVKAPPPEEIPSFLGYHVGPSLRFLLAGNQAGVRGRVTDPEGRPVEARFLSPQAAWPGYSDPETGAFARPLPPGSYELQVLAEGHQTVTVNVDVPAGGVAEIDVELPRLADLVVGRTERLEVRLSGTWEARVCGELFAEIVGAGGHATLGRPGLAGPFALDTWAEDDCAVFTLDGSVIAAPAVPEGEWSWALRDASGDVRAWMPLGVLLEAPSPGFRLDDAEITEQPDGIIIDVLGVDLPEGALVRFIGPRGERVLPVHLGGTSERISVAVDASEWAIGPWSIRAFGNGHHIALPGVLEVDEDGLRAGPPPFRPTAPPDGDAKGEPTPLPTPSPTPPAASGDGCTCSASPTSPRGLVLLLPLATLLRRRSR